VKKTPEEGYHFMEDMTDKAIGWIGQQKALIPDKPFFIYFAPARRTRRITCPKEWADKYKGKFDRAGTRCARRRSTARRSSA
jgi:arylsulfatase